MCAIAGEINFKTKATTKSTTKMLRTMRSRGPDGSNSYKHQHLSFGMNRLAIIDLSTGDQPLYNEDKSIVIIGNGEIYNYLELQKSLQDRGHVLRSKSDIETAAHLYEEYGESFVKHLRGMFALAIYDKKNQKVILARDRIGEKPIYFYSDSNSFYFASELKAILSIPGVNVDLDKNSVGKYFLYSYIPEPETIFKNIQRVPAATLVSIDIEKKQIHDVKYWDHRKINASGETNPKNLIKQKLSYASDISSRSDVEVGISLSGGIDSTAILAFVSKNRKNKITKAFSIGYKGSPKTDERSLAKESAKKYGVDFIDKEISPEEFVSDFPMLIKSLDEPVADLAAYSVYSIAKLAHEHKIKVLLGGLGGDELFWGYPWVRDMIKNSDGDKFNLYEGSPLYQKGGKFTKYFLTNDIKNRLILHKKNVKKKDLAKETISQLLETWLLSDCITLSDRLSMACSVETRAPFVDYKLVEYALKSKKNIKGHDKGQKYWLKQALEGTVSQNILNQTKRGFTPPVTVWLSSLFKKHIHLIINGFLVEQKILTPYGAKIITLVWRAMPMYWEQIYHILVLETWARIYIKKEKP